MVRNSALVFTIFISVFSVGAGEILAQEYDIERFTVSNGLSQGMVSNIIQDSDGFLWMGTLSGLNRYDGTRIKNYTHDSRDSNSLASNLITGLFEDSKGRIWVGTNESLECYDRKTGVFHHIRNGNVALDYTLEGVKPFKETEDGRIWCIDKMKVFALSVPKNFTATGLGTVQVQVYQTFGNFSVSTKSDIIPLNLMQNLAIYHSEGERFVYDKATNKFLQKEAKLDVNNVAASNQEIIFDNFRNGYWSREGKSFFFIKDGRIQQTFSIPSYTTKRTNVDFDKDDACCDKYGNIWILNGHEVLKVTPATNGEQTKIEVVFKENYHFIRIFQDRDGTIWIGTNGYGVIHIKPRQNYFQTVFAGTSFSGLLPKDSSSFYCVSNSAVSVCNVNETKASTPIQRQPPYVSKIRNRENTTFAFYYKSQDFRLLIEYSNGKKVDIPAFQGQLIFSYHHPVIIDNKDRLWVPNLNGELLCLPKGSETFLHYSFAHLWQKEINVLPIKQMYQSDNGTYWLSTPNGLVEMQIDAVGAPKFKLWKNDPNIPQSLSSSSILSVLDDPKAPNRYLWVTTNGAGINKMDKQTGLCVTYTKSDGLPNNVVYGALSDSYGRLWLSTNYGLSCFNETEKYFWNFEKRDGLQDDEFNTHSFLEMPNKTFCFGGVSGLNIFKADNILPKAAFSPVFITQISVNNKTITFGDSTRILTHSIEYSKAIRLTHTQNQIALTFSALDFTKNNTSNYYYKLEGVDADWVFSGNKNEVRYTNLNSGTYTFYVANINDLGLKNPNPTSLKITVLPPWWRTWAAYFSYLLVCLTVVGLLFRLQLERLRTKSRLAYNAKEAARLLEIDALKGRFFSNITHEFKTPLTLILEPARQMSKADNMRDVQSHSNIIVKNANRLLLLVNQLLDLSKLEDGKLKPNLLKGDIMHVLKNCFDDALPLVSQKQQQLFWNTPDRVLHGATDPDFLSKIVNNLISNAHKFTPVGGRIEMRIQQTNETHWQLQIIDNGAGIPSNAVNLVFDRFYQVDSSNTRRGEGTGIGLALVKELCLLLGGTVQVESAVNAGTTFTMEFPLWPNGEMQGVLASSGSYNPQNEAVDEVKLAPIEENATAANKESVLVVEDNDEMRDFLKIILNQNGYHVVEAVNGRAGLETALEIMPDFIITDVMMPEMDGYQLTESLKNNTITSHIPIIMLTAKGKQLSRMEGFRSGADVFISKPFHSEELLLRLSNLAQWRNALQLKRQAPHSVAPSVEVSFVDEQNDNIALHDEMDALWLEKVESLIFQQMQDQNLTIDTLTPALHMSRVQFYAKIKALTGLLPAQLIRNIRLDHARKLLIEQPDLPIADVVYQIGLKDIKNFNLIFQERFQCTPKSFRNKKT